LTEQRIEERGLACIRKPGNNDDRPFTDYFAERNRSEQDVEVL